MEPAPPPPTLPRRQEWLAGNALRVSVAVLMTVIVGFALFEAIHNPLIHSFVRHPQHHAGEIHDWSSRHSALAPFAFLGLFVSLGAFALPVWWLQIIAGAAFGLARGLLLGMIASVITSVVAASLSRFVFADLLRSRLKSHTDRLTRLDAGLNHNGLLVVCGVRLLHFIPAGLSNYAFGLTQISIRDLAVGTVIGGLPSTLSLVAIGAKPNLLNDWRFIALLVALNITTFLVLVVRYFRPQWFRRFGLE